MSRDARGETRAPVVGGRVGVTGIAGLARVAGLVGLAGTCVLLAASIPLGCGGAAQVAPTLAAAHLEPARLFPLAAGTVWSFNVRTDDGLPTFATLRVLSVDGARSQVQRNRQAPETFVTDATGVRHEDGTYVLRAPITLGASWPAGEARTARVTAIDERVRTGLGELEGCVRVVELDDDTGIEAATVYCADVGPALIVSTMTSTMTGDRLEVRAELLGRTELETP